MNTILDDKQRELYKDTIQELFTLCPDTIKKKFVRANVQQAFVLKAAKDLSNKNSAILSIGAYEDTCSESLRKLGYNIVEIDPDNAAFPKTGDVSTIINCDLHTYRNVNKEKKFDTIIATSVIEHVPNDNEFVDDICNMLKAGGFGILTCDFNNNYVPGFNKPDVDYRLYTKNDLLTRFKAILTTNNCEIYGDVNYESPPDFLYAGSIYSFASYVFKKNNV